MVSHGNPSLLVPLSRMLGVRRGVALIAARDLAIGIPLGLSAFYGLSLASAFWVARITDTDYVWGILIGAAVCGLLGATIAWRAAYAVAASVTMFVLVLLGTATGSQLYLWVPPFANDVVPLLWHGSRSPVVIGPLVLVGTSAIIRVVSEARRRREQRGATRT